MLNTMELLLMLKDCYKVLLILSCVILICTMNYSEGRYPEECTGFDDKFCYDVEEVPMTYQAAKYQCSKRGGVTEVDGLPLDLYILLAERNPCYWTFQFDGSLFCHQYNLGHNCDSGCYNKIPSVCKIPSKECKISELRKLIPNAYFKNCSETALPMQEITIECKEGFILQKGPNNVRCQFDGKWSSTPQCMPGCLQPKLSNNSYLLQMKNMYEVGERAHLLCKNNFIALWKYPITSIVIECLNTGFWSDSLPDCLPVDSLSYHYDFTKNKQFTVRAAFGDQVQLQICELRKSFYEGIDKKITWYRDQIEFKGNHNGQISISESDYTLKISSFTIEDMGIYNCVIQDKATSSVLDSCSYQLGLTKQCSKKIEEQFLSISYPEGTDQIIRCPSENFIYRVHWFKDGHRFWGDNDHILMPDGSLYFRNISVKDERNYSCTYLDVQSSCEGKSEVKITIIRKVVCGRLDESYSMVFARPWIATLWTQGEVIPFCYATLIDLNWLVTTASCIIEFQRKGKLDFLVKLGATSASLDSTTVYEVLKVRLHPKYSKRLRSNDIALIKLKQNIKYTNDIYPICYLGSNIQENSCNEFNSGTVTGWGPLNSVQEIDKVRYSRETMVIVNNTECNLPNIIRNELSDHMFCARRQKTGHNIAGDHGSAFEIKLKNHWYLWGIMSWGEQISKTEDFDYFIKISYFENWIESTIKE